MDFMVFKVVDDIIFESLIVDIEVFGLEVIYKVVGDLKDCGCCIQFIVFFGYVFELYVDKVYIGKWGVEEINLEVWFRVFCGMKVVCFDYCLLYGDELVKIYDLFVDVLGFYLVEQVFDFDGNWIVQFLMLLMKVYDIVFIQYEEKVKFYYVLFYFEIWEDIFCVVDFISMINIFLDIGFIWYGIIYGKIIYFFDLLGNCNEVFVGGDYMYFDYNFIIWKVEDLGKVIFYYDCVFNECFLMVLI